MRPGLAQRVEQPLREDPRLAAFEFPHPPLAGTETGREVALAEATDDARLLKSAAKGLRCADFTSDGRGDLLVARMGA